MSVLAFTICSVWVTIGVDIHVGRSTFMVCVLKNCKKQLQCWNNLAGENTVTNNPDMSRFTWKCGALKMMLAVSRDIGDNSVEGDWGQGGRALTNYCSSRYRYRYRRKKGWKDEISLKTNGLNLSLLDQSVQHKNKNKLILAKMCALHIQMWTADIDMSNQMTIPTCRIVLWRF